MQEIRGVVRRRSVFVSSKFEGLEEHRRILIDGILREQHIPVAMEYFGTHLIGKTIVNYIKKEVSSSEIFVAIIGAELGQRDVKDALTYVQQEVKEAKALKLPIIPVLLNDNEHINAKTERRRKGFIDNDYEDRLEQLRKEVTEVDGQKIGAIYFSLSDAPKNLLAKFIPALNDIARGLPDTGGFVDGYLFDQLINRPMIQGVAAKNSFFESFTKRMSEFGTLSGRVQRWQSHKVAAAQFFWSTYFPSIVRNKVRRIFFESGSAIAYVTRYFIDHMTHCTSREDQAFSENLTLLTNNFISLLALVLTESSSWRWSDVRLFPPGSISDTYGATYGTILRSVRRINSPTEDMMQSDFRFLDHDAESQLEACLHEFAEALGQQALVLMTASGIDTRRKIYNEERYNAPARIDQIGLAEEDILQIKNGDVTERPDFTPFPGPHTGDFLNMMIKRVLLKQNCPRVIFLDEYKWGLDFIPGNCFAVCDDSFPWHCISGPLAIVMAARTNAVREKMTSELLDIGLKVRARSSPAQGASDPCVLVAANDAFEQVLPRFNR